jgi:hypothetical protein
MTSSKALKHILFAIAYTLSIRGASAQCYANAGSKIWNETSQTGVDCLTNWACSVQCKATHSYDKLESHDNIGSCGAGKYSDYLKSEPCTSKLKEETDYILSLYAGCDYNVCAAACDGLTVDADMPYASTIWHGSLLHCFKVLDSNSFSYKDISQNTSLDSTVIKNGTVYVVTETMKSHKALAEEAGVALGCSPQAMVTNPANAYYLNGCYDKISYQYNFNTSSDVKAEDFCYGGWNPDKTVCASYDSPTCVASPTNVCVTVNYFDGETGYYYLDSGDGPKGPSPTIKTYVGQTITFNQRDHTNWYHPIGFAYEPDGAHGSKWGSQTPLPEVEGKGELQYKIGGKVPRCLDHGDTGLDCYEPEFFYPKNDWISAGTYSAELTITDSVINSPHIHGGIIYYFCHIHSKMSGKIEIYTDASLSTLAGSGPELELYEVIVRDDFDKTCGTTGTSKFKAGGVKDCKQQFFGGTHDSEWENCLQAIDCQMHWDMYGKTQSDATDKVKAFMQQMIPHHQNAVNMAKVILKQATQAELKKAGQEMDEDDDAFIHFLHSIINVQNHQIHTMRNYLKEDSGDLKISPENIPTAGAHLSNYSLLLAILTVIMTTTICN